MPQPLLLPCCVEAPPAYAPKARYAIRALVRGLGAEPRWVDRAYLIGPSLYYGPEPAAVAGPHTVAVRLDAATSAFFASGEPYAAERVLWAERDEGRYPVLFGGVGEEDLIASTFFWLSGWQEHTEPAREVHGRYPFEASLQARWGTACEPAVDLYRLVLGERLARAGFVAIPTRWAGKSWAFCATHDIDYLRKWRPGIVFREAVEYPLLNRRGVPPAERWARLKASARQAVGARDPFRVALGRMVDEVLAHRGRATYFFKAGANGPHDVGYSLNGPFIQIFFARLRREGFEIGLHPSYHAHDHPGRMVEERDRLTAAARVRPASVRQHYLRYEPARTPALQLGAGFELDATLGFSVHEGFRHGTCHPFTLFDIAANAELPLWEIPLCMMEAALFNRRCLSVEEAVAVSRDLIDTCRRFGGVCAMLWHNTLWDEVEFPGWGRHFTETLDAATAGGGCLTSLHMALDAYR